jgi:hypothetical protein
VDHEVVLLSFSVRCRDPYNGTGLVARIVGESRYHHRCGAVDAVEFLLQLLLLPQGEGLVLRDARRGSQAGTGGLSG